MSSANSRVKRTPKNKPITNGRGLSWASREDYIKDGSFLDMVPPEQLGHTIIQLNVGSTTEDLEDYIRKHGKALTRGGKGLIGFVPGYEYDPRELWEIPEVIELFKRVIDSGLLSLFAGNIPSQEDFNPYGIGASQIYCTVHETGVKRAGKWCWDRMDCKKFIDVYMSGNSKVDKLIAE